MARPKPGEVNKSQAIREYIAQHKRAKASTVVEALAEKGIEVPASLVYNIRGKNRTRRGGVRTSAGPKTAKGNGKFSESLRAAHDSLVAAQKLVAAVGGIENAKQALKLLEQLEQLG